MPLFIKWTGLVPLGVYSFCQLYQERQEIILLLPVLVLNFIRMLYDGKCDLFKSPFLHVIKSYPN